MGVVCRSMNSIDAFISNEISLKRVPVYLAPARPLVHSPSHGIPILYFLLSLIFGLSLILPCSPLCSSFFAGSRPPYTLARIDLGARMVHLIPPSSIFHKISRRTDSYVKCTYHRSQAKVE